MASDASGTDLALSTSRDVTSMSSNDLDTVKRLEGLPSEVGILLMILGVAGLILPGPVGTPFVIAGGVALYPRAFGRIERWFQRNCPGMHHSGMTQIGRYLTDLERRYPGSTVR